jgi:hypothetical protein
MHYCRELLHTVLASSRSPPAAMAAASPATPAAEAESRWCVVCIERPPTVGLLHNGTGRHCSRATPQEPPWIMMPNIFSQLDNAMIISRLTKPRGAPLLLQGPQVLLRGVCRLTETEEGAMPDLPARHRRHLEAHFLEGMDWPWQPIPHVYTRHPTTFLYFSSFGRLASPRP